jgi:hypothetical protein
MVKFELEIDVSSWTCVSVDETSSTLLGAQRGSLLEELLDDSNEVDDWKRHVQELLQDSNEHAFATFTLVFKAPGASVGSPGIDRSPINGGMKAIGEWCLPCWFQRGRC